jgi:hypothetical protein
MRWPDGRSRSSVGRTAAWIIALLLLLFTGAAGVYNGITEWGDGRTPMQHSVTLGVFLYGVFGLITSYGLVRRRGWSLKLGIGWAVCVTYVSGVAVMADGDEEAMLSSAIAASVGSALIAIGVLWAVNLRTRGDDKTAANPE